MLKLWKKLRRTWCKFNAQVHFLFYRASVLVAMHNLHQCTWCVRVCCFLEIDFFYFSDNYTIILQLNLVLNCAINYFFMACLHFVYTPKLSFHIPVHTNTIQHHTWHPCIKSKVMPHGTHEHARKHICHALHACTRIRAHTRACVHGIWCMCVRVRVW